jgi:hypothetical protein
MPEPTSMPAPNTKAKKKLMLIAAINANFKANSKANSKAKKADVIANAKAKKSCCF